VVSGAMPAQGKLAVIGCGDAGRVELRRLRRHRAPHNRAFDDADRGDVLAIDRAVDDGRLDILGDTHVERIALPSGHDRD
jgi:hypothetical protein